MITFKKFAMAVMLLAGFQQVSADVCKLKVNDAIKYALQIYKKVWVDSKNGDIWRKDSEKYKFLYTTFQVPIGVNDRDDTIGLVCITHADQEVRDDNAIFINNEGEVVINLNGITRDENDEDFKKRRSDEEAKRQFKNIIKCGLIVPVRQCDANGVLLREDDTQATFNPRIFDTQFTVLQSGNWVCNEKWKMPGISADISNLTLTSIPVMCAMKRDIKTEVGIHKNSLKSYIDNNQLFSLQSYFDDRIDRLRREAYLYCELKNLNKIKTRLTLNDKEKIINDIISTEDTLLSQEMYKRLIMRDNWKKIFSPEKCDFIIYATEHTERQLLAYHCLKTIPVNGWLTDVSQKWCNVTPYEEVKQNNYTSRDHKHLLIYTHGAPCFDEDGKCKDNGGMCCWNLYRDCIQNNINVDVYFSQFMYHELLDNDRRKNILGKMFDLYALLYGGVEGCDKELENLYKAIFKLDYKRDETLHRELVRSKLKLENDCGKSYERFEEYLKKSDWKDKPNIQIHWVNHNY